MLFLVDMNDDNKNINKAGRLIMAANSIGDPRDIPLRTLEALKTADLLIFEEDRPARLALKTAGIHREYIKYSEHSQEQTLADLRQCLRAGGTALYMSDQGCPTLADPGQPVLQLAYQLGSTVRVIPGASSVTAALAACPFDSRQFLYLGFLPREGPDRLRVLGSHQRAQTLLIILDTPYRLLALLESCEVALPKQKRLFVALDITGPQEQYWLGTAAQLVIKAKALTEKLNFVLIIDR